jgi:hypothetical protein
VKPTSAKSTTVEIDPIFSELNLDSVGGNFFVGHFDRVPFKLELISNEQTIGLLFQTRFSKTKQPIPENVPVPPGSALESLIAEKKAEFTADDDRAWFNLFAAHELIERGELIAVLKEFTIAMKAYVDYDDQPCFACKQTKATLPIYHSDKLHLVCDACNDQINLKAANLTKTDPVHFGFLLLWAFSVALIGGLIWALGWFAFDLIFGGRTVTTSMLTLAFIALACIVAGPIALVFKKLPRRSPHLPKLITAFTCILIAVFGEIAYSTYFFVSGTGHWPDLSQTVAVWRWMMAESDPIYGIGKLITLGAIWFFTNAWSTKSISLEQAAAPTFR